MHSFRFCLLSFPVLFPFVLPCLAPAAVRQVLIFRFHSDVLPWLPLSFVRFRFRLLTTQPLHFSFPLFHCFALQPGFPASRFSFRLPVFPLSSGLVSRTFRPILSTQLFCSFPFALPCFAPTAVPQVLPFWISPPGSTPSFRFLSSSFALASHYSAF